MDQQLNRRVVTVTEQLPRLRHPFQQLVQVGAQLAVVFFVQG